MAKILLAWYCLVSFICTASTGAPCSPEDLECVADYSVSLLQKTLDVESVKTDKSLKEVKVVAKTTRKEDGQPTLDVESVKTDKSLKEVKVVAKPAIKEEPVPKFNEKTMPAVSTTMKCVMNLTYQYFGLFTALAIVRTLISFKFDLVGVQRILETGCNTVVYAPMLSVLFVGGRLRALQLTQGDTDKYGLPQDFVKTSMVLCSYAVLLQVVFVLLVGMMSGISNVTTDAEGNLDLSGMKDANPMAMMGLTIARYVVMAMLYGGFSAVVYGILTMQGPAEVWAEAGGSPPVSPAVQNTILLTFIFFLIYLLVAVTKTIFELVPSMRTEPMLLKLEASAGAAKMTINFAPMLAILFIGTRMRALAIDPLHGNPQSYAQQSMYLCTISVLVQAICGIVLPFVTNAEIKRGECEGDVAFVMENKTMGVVMECVRYVCLLMLYGGLIAIVYSVFTIEHPDGPEMTPPLSPALACTLALSLQYFSIYSALFVCITVKSFILQSGHLTGGRLTPVADLMGKAIYILDAARSTVMFAPMLSILCIGTRMRAQQLAIDSNGNLPPSFGPQPWAQTAMRCATGAVFIQLVMTIIVPILTGVDKPELDVDGNVKMPAGGGNLVAMIVELIRYMNLIFMYVGATVLCVGVVMMTPETCQPYVFQQ